MIKDVMFILFFWNLGYVMVKPAFLQEMKMQEKRNILKNVTVLADYSTAPLLARQKF